MSHRETQTDQPSDIEKKNSDVDKNIDNQHDNKEKMLKLLAEVVVQIIIKEAAEAAKSDEATKESNV